MAEIGGLVLESPLILGPMAGVTSGPFRQICREMGAACVSTEMISANAVKYGNKKTLELIDIVPGEHPVSMQIFGPDPDTMAEAVGKLGDQPFDILDINMGCPMPKIVNNGEGSALMRDPERAEAIVRACVRACDRPVTVKMRKGFGEGEETAPELAKRCEAAGAAAVAVHGRTREQYYTGKADWGVIRRVKEAVSIPVIGNGDVTSPELAVKMMEETGCDFVMLARGARGNPWIFRRTLEYMGLREPGPPWSLPERVREVYEMILRHTDMQIAGKGSYLGICQMRKHIAWYTTGLPGSSALREAVNRAEDREQLVGVLQDWKERAERMAAG